MTKYKLTEKDAKILREVRDKYIGESKLSMKKLKRDIEIDYQKITHNLKGK